MPISKDGPSSSKTPSSAPELFRVAKSLNEETDRLNDAVALVAETLKPLNLGVTSWHKFFADEDGPFWVTEEVGYAKVKGKWGIALRKTTGDESSIDEADEKIWPFDEAPRELRIRGAGFLPALIEKLHADAEEVVASVGRNTVRITELAGSLSTGNGSSKGAK